MFESLKDIYSRIDERYMYVFFFPGGKIKH